MLLARVNGHVNGFLRSGSQTGSNVSLIVCVFPKRKRFLSTEYNTTYGSDFPLESAGGRLLADIT